MTPRESHHAPRVAQPVVTPSSPPSFSSLETVISDAHIRTGPVWGPFFASEAVRVSGWRVRDLIHQLVARIGVVEAKERDVAVELRNTKEQLVIANTKVMTWREGADRFRDRAPLGCSLVVKIRRVEWTVLMITTTTIVRAAGVKIIERTFAITGVVVMPLKNVVAPRSTPTVMIRVVTTIATMITVVGRVVSRV